MTARFLSTFICVFVVTMALCPSANAVNPSLDVIVPSVPGLDIEAIPTAADGDPINLPKALENVVDSRISAMNVAPAWVKALRSKTVFEYFPADRDDKSAAWSKGAQALLADATKLHEYFEQSDRSGLYNGFVEKNSRSS